MFILLDSVQNHDFLHILYIHRYRLSSYNVSAVGSTRGDHLVWKKNHMTYATSPFICESPQSLKQKVSLAENLISFIPKCGFRFGHTS